MWQQIINRITGIFTWVIIVAPWEQAIRVRRGRGVKLLKSGMHLRIPVLDRVYRQPTRRRMNTIQPQTLTTIDRTTITLSSTIGYAIIDLLKLFEALHDASDTIEAEAAALIAKYVTSNRIEECNPSQIEDFVRAHLKMDRYGLGEIEFYICNFAVVKTFRIIQGTFKEWQRGSALDTTKELHQEST